MENNFKKCPFCAEEIKSDAIKCKHCGSMLNEKITIKEKAEYKITGIIKTRIILSLILLVAFFMPWITFPMIGSYSGYNLPFLMEKIFSFLSYFTEDSKYLLLGYLLFLIPICSIYNILNRLFNLTKAFLLDEFVIGLLFSLFLIYLLYDANTEFYNIISIGLYLTFFVSLIGTLFNFFSTIYEIIKNEKKEPQKIIEGEKIIPQAIPKEETHIEQTLETDETDNLNKTLPKGENKRPKNRKKKLIYGIVIFIGILATVILIVAPKQNDNNRRAKEEIKNQNDKYEDARKKERKNKNEEKRILEIITSSEMKNATVSGIHFTFAAENIRDNNLKTWWSPTTNDVYTSWIKIVFAGEEVISRMDIHGGSHYPDFPENDLYEHNYRLRTGTITFSDNTEIGFELRDIDRIQTIEFPEKETKYIIIKPKTFYETKKYKDFCVSEIKVY